MVDIMRTTTMRVLMLVALTPRRNETKALDLFFEESDRFISAFLETQLSRKDGRVLMTTSVPPLEPPKAPMTPMSCSERTMDESIKSFARCMPRPTVIKINSPNNSWDMIPTFTTVHRCSGGCFNPTREECYPTHIATTMTPILLGECGDKTGRCQKSCGKIQLVNHTDCACACISGKAECPQQTHIYDAKQCTCTCKNHKAMSNCSGTGHSWDEKSCTCPKSAIQGLPTAKANKTSGNTIKQWFHIPLCGVEHYLLSILIALVVALSAGYSYLILKLRTPPSSECMDNLESSRHSGSSSPVFRQEYVPIMNWKFLEEDLDNQTTYDMVRRPPRQVTPEGRYPGETLVVMSEVHKSKEDTTYETMACIHDQSLPGDQDTGRTRIITRAVMETQC